MDWPEYLEASKQIQGPVIVELEACDAHLYYLGWPDLGRDDPALRAQLEARWKELEPQVAFSPHRFRMPPPIRKPGPDGRPQPEATGIYGYDDALITEISNLRDAGYSAPQIKLFLMLEGLPQLAHREEPAAAESWAVAEMARLSSIKALDAPPRSLDEVEVVARNLLPQLKDWRQIEASAFDPEVFDDTTYTHALARKRIDLADEHAIQLLTEPLAAHVNVVAVNDARRVLRQRDRLIGVADDVKCMRARRPPKPSRHR